jgi:hypothetical protein
MQTDSEAHRHRFQWLPEGRSAELSGRFLKLTPLLPSRYYQRSKLMALLYLLY